jgi:hypothetical protein
MNAKFKLLLLTALFGLAWMLPVQAQDEDKNNVARLVHITPKADHEKSLIEGITKYHHWIAQFEGHHRYTWYRIATGPNTGKFIARTGNHSWADFDAEYDWQDQAGEKFQELVAPHIADMTVEYTEEMKDFAHWPESFDGYTHFSVTEWYVKNGQWGKFREGLKTIVDALKEGGYPGHWGFFSLESGGHGGQIRIVGANKGWSDLAEEDPSFLKIMSEKLGGAEEFQAFMADWGSTYKSGHNMMLILMPDASDYGDE